MTRRWQAVASRGLPHFVAVADGGDDILGYAYAGPYHTRPGYRFTVEDSIYVAPMAQRQGIGEALLARLIGTCEAMGLRQMIAIIGGTDPAGSVRLHSKLGFRQISRIQASGFKHGKWLDTVLMQRALGPGNKTLPEER
jgi:phosphinothricin acetyltransferase